MFFKHRKKNKATKHQAQEETVIFDDEPLQAAPDLEDDTVEETADPANSALAQADGDEVELEEEVIEIEFDEDDVLYYLVDEDDVTVGFVLADEQGEEAEYYFTGEEIEQFKAEEEEKSRTQATAAASSSKPKNNSLAYKAGAAAAGAATAGKAAAKTGVEKAKHGVEKARGWADKFQPNDDGEYDLGITREGVEEATHDMNAIYHESVETIAELKGAFDDIKEGLSLDGLLGKKKR